MCAIAAMYAKQCRFLLKYQYFLNLILKLIQIFRTALSKSTLLWMNEQHWPWVEITRNWCVAWLTVRAGLKLETGAAGSISSGGAGSDLQQVRRVGLQTVQGHVATPGSKNGVAGLLLLLEKANSRGSKIGFLYVYIRDDHLHQHFHNEYAHKHHRHSGSFSFSHSDELHLSYFTTSVLTIPTDKTTAGFTHQVRVRAHCFQMWEEGRRLEKRLGQELDEVKEENKKKII